MISIPPALARLHTTLKARLDTPVDLYQIPGRWVHPQNSLAVVQIHPHHWWLHTLERLLETPPQPLFRPETTGGEWSRYARVYNLFVRSLTAFDHDGDGQLGRPNRDGLNEAGSFMKSLCILPYIQSLGCNTVHLLPITAIGQDGNKGDAGSPYAIRNPYRLDELSAEPTLGLGAEAEFAAFVAAAHHLGLRVVTEFVFRTGSKDSDWVGEHPEWFYWIDADIPDRVAGSLDEEAYGMPIFSAAEIEQIEQDVADGQMDDLLPPHAGYRAMFLPPPQVADVRLAAGRWRATYPDGRAGRIPGAFADWPVNDPQPPWGDVTYLRLYDRPDFNYIAYNTLRMYDTRLAQTENIVVSLWEKIINIIPYFQTNFGIDGAMIDMGHALPMSLKQQMVAAARTRDPNFAFWDENFRVTQASRAEGYNAVIGSLPFILFQPEELRKLVMDIGRRGTPIPFFGALESHNTPRAASKPGGSDFIRYGAAIAACLPALPFIHNGVEFGETYPINTGLGFTKAEIAQLPSHTLPLFSARAFDWEHGDPDLAAWWQRTLQLREQFETLLSDPHPETQHLIVTDQPDVWAILRHDDAWSTKVALVCNSSHEAAHTTRIYMPTGREMLMDHYSGRYYRVEQEHITLTLEPLACVWLEL